LRIHFSKSANYLLSLILLIKDLNFN